MPKIDIAKATVRTKGVYPDVDLVGDKDGRGFRFSHRSGEPYPQEP